MKLFDSPGGATMGWIHYLAFDLFTGMWIARDADQKGFSRAVQFPFLFLTLMAGPVGLFAWLIIPERRARVQQQKCRRNPGSPATAVNQKSDTHPPRCATPTRARPREE